MYCGHNSEVIVGQWRDHHQPLLGVEQRHFVAVQRPVHLHVRQDKALIVGAALKWNKGLLTHEAVPSIAAGDPPRVKRIGVFTALHLHFDIVSSGPQIKYLAGALDGASERL